MECQSTYMHLRGNIFAGKEMRMEHSMKFAEFVHMDMYSCSSTHGRLKIASDMLTFPSVRMANNTESVCPCV